MSELDQQNAIDIAHMQSDVDYLKESVDGIHAKMDSFIGSCDKRYAAKYVEKLLWLVGSVFIAGFAGALWELVVKK